MNLFARFGLLSIAILALATASPLASRALGDAHGAPVALVYRGTGACPEGCADAAAESAKAAGLEPRFVGPDEIGPEIFNGAVVWIQPGGHSSEVSKAMKPELKQNIRAFLWNGGGYVGYCAGGFFATDSIAQQNVPGLGILPGRNLLLQPPGVPIDPNGKDTAIMIPVQWGGQGAWKTRQLYWEGGPFFVAPSPDIQMRAHYEVMATYPDGSIASVRSLFGAGRVYVTGLHPEAPDFWRTYYHLQDGDGRDLDLAVEMVRWASRATPGF